MYTEEINKTALSSNDDKRLQTFGKYADCPFYDEIMLQRHKDEKSSKCLKQ